MAQEPNPQWPVHSGHVGRVWRWLWGSRTRRRQLLVSTLVLAVLVVAWHIPLPYYVTTPGSAHDAAAMVEVPAGVDREHRGRFLVLTVTSRQANPYWYLYARLYPDRVELESRREFLGAYPDFQIYYSDSVGMMEESRRFAAAAALRALGYPVEVRRDGARIVALLEHSPAAGIIRPGDRILAVAGRAIPDTEGLTAALRRIPPGQDVTMTIQRDGERLEVTVPTTVHEGREGAAVGVLVRTAYVVDLPMKVRIDPQGITGPSAGLIFSLEIMEQLTGEPLGDGAVVAGTGTVDPEGRVGAVGSVAHKVHAAERAGADVIFVPVENGDEARSAAREIEVVPVERVADAVAWLRSRFGRSGPGAPGVR